MLSSLETAPKATQPDACDPEHPVLRKKQRHKPQSCMPNCVRGKLSSGTGSAPSRHHALFPGVSGDRIEQHELSKQAYQQVVEW